jgi:hypothetical protein
MPSPSASFDRLREFLASRMRMSHVYQPLMLKMLIQTALQAQGGNITGGASEAQSAQASCGAMVQDNPVAIHEPPDHR